MIFNMGVADLLITGVKLVGTLPKIGIWRPDERQANMSVKASLHNSVEAKQALKRQRRGAWTKIDQEVVKCTLQEVREDHLRGSFSEKEIDERLGSSAWLPARSFPVEQNDKLHDVFSKCAITQPLVLRKRFLSRGWTLLSLFLERAWNRQTIMVGSLSMRLRARSGAPGWTTPGRCLAGATWLAGSQI